MAKGSHVIIRGWLPVLEYMKKESSPNTSRRPPIDQIECLAYSYSIIAEIDTQPDDLNMEVIAIKWQPVGYYQVSFRSQFTR